MPKLAMPKGQIRLAWNDYGTRLMNQVVNHERGDGPWVSDSVNHRRRDRGIIVGLCRLSTHRREQDLIQTDPLHLPESRCILPARPLSYGCGSGGHRC